MTRWGVLLIMLYVGLGLSEKRAHKAAVISAWVTGVVVTFVMAKTVL